MTETGSFSANIDHEQVAESRDILGDNFAVLVKKFIVDAEDHLLEMSVLRGAGQDHEVGAYAHQLKSSAFQVGAIKVSAIASTLDKLINDNQDNIHHMDVQTKLDSLIEALQTALHDYKSEIQNYL